MLDFNDDVPTNRHDTTRDEIRAELLARLDSLLPVLFPAGKIQRNKFTVGNLDGDPGDSLEVSLNSGKAGLWKDHATNDGGDIFDLIAAVNGIDARTEFQRVLDTAERLLGTAPSKEMVPSKGRKLQPIDELGPVTAQWSYYSTDGKLLATVYRHDPPAGKTFRPWDAAQHKYVAPEIRPLYNQQGMVHSQQVILVEGEKCAQALIDAGYCATTAMSGANAPVNKTDWSPLAGKTVLIWPDRDKPGWSYAENVQPAILRAGATSCDVLFPPSDKPEKWDAADAVLEGFDIDGFLRDGQRNYSERTASSIAYQLVDVRVERGGIHIAARQVCQALGGQYPRVVFQRSGMLVRVSRNPVRIMENGVSIPSGNPLIHSLGQSDLMVRIMDACNLLYARKGTKGEVRWVSDDCNTRLADIVAILYGDAWGGIPELAGFSEVPIIRPDGSIHDQEGYDSVSQLYYVANLPPLAIPAHPAREDAVAAANRVLEPFSQFPFCSVSSHVYFLFMVIIVYALIMYVK